MKLQNPFPDSVRNLYLYRYDCDLCGSNKMLELHHIIGRKSCCALNASLVCKECHSHMGHTQKEEQKLFNENLRFLHREGYKFTKSDEQFIRDHQWLVSNNIYLIQWLSLH